MADATSRSAGPLSRLIDFFLRSNVAPLICVLSLIAGLAAVMLTPRKEEPQIVVQMADVMVSAPGLPAAEVERQISTPLEKLLFQIDGVEHVYSISRSGEAVVTVRFYVGEDREDSLVKIYNKLHSHTDTIPPDVAAWVIKPVEIDDVPIVIASLWSDRSAEIDDHALRRVAEEIELQAIPETNRTQFVGGHYSLKSGFRWDPGCSQASRFPPASARVSLFPRRRCVGSGSWNSPMWCIENASCNA